MSKISVTQKGTWGMRFKLILDGETKGLISKGEIKEFDVSSGQHTLKAEMGNYGSKTLNLNVFNHEIKKITVSPNKTAYLFQYISLLNFGLMAYLLAAKSTPKSIYIILFFVILILSFYFLIIRKKRFINIKEY